MLGRARSAAGLLHGRRRRRSSTSTSSSPRSRSIPTSREANRDLLDEGTLHVARFNADGSGDWLPLVHGQGPLTAANGFGDQGEVLVKTRQAADLLGATKMDRAGVDRAAPGHARRVLRLHRQYEPRRRRQRGPNPANRRAPNPFGHILRWQEDGGDPAATRFRWDVFVEAGLADKGATIRGDLFANPDGLWIDSMGALWVETDTSPGNLGKGDFAPMGNNQLLAVDPAAGVFKRFLTGPRGCEITGFHTTPDNRTRLRQHPAPRRGAGRPLRSGQSARALELARLLDRRAPALGHRRHPPPRRGIVGT